MIEGFGDYKVITVKSGEEALAEVNRHKRLFGYGDNKIECILLDIGLPGMTGLDFLRILRKEESKQTFSRYIPVVMLTAHDSQKTWMEATDTVTGIAAGYLTKPFEKLVLSRLLHRIVIEKDIETLIEITEEAQFKRKKDSE